MVAKRAGIYVRISDDREGAGLGVARQQADCQDLCQRLGWTVHDVYVDNDISAYSGKRRPSYERLLDDLEAGTITAVAAWHPDRLHRAPIELEHFIAVIETAKAHVATATAGTYDLATPSGRMVARTLGNAARYESEHKAERIRRKHLQLAEAGQRHGGGTRQFGFVNADTLDQDEAELVRLAARRVLAGETIRSICTDWNRQGVATVTGALWKPPVLRRILTAPSTAGIRSHNGVNTPGTWPAILDASTHERLRAILLDPARRTNTVARRYLLAGLLHCGNCGTRMVARPRRESRRAYVCTRDVGGCGRMGVLAEPLEDEIRKILVEWVDTPAVARATRRAVSGEQETTEQQLLDAIQADEAKLTEWMLDADAGKITRAQLYAVTQTINDRVDAARRQLGHVHHDHTAAEWDGKGQLLDARWDAMSLDQQRAILGTYIEAVTIGPAVRGRNRFDEERLLPERGGGISWLR